MEGAGVGVFSRIEVVYKQPRKDKKVSDLFYYRGSSYEELMVFNARIARERRNPAHNSSGFSLLPFSEIEKIILLGHGDQVTGEFIPIEPVEVC